MADDIERLVPALYRHKAKFDLARVKTAVDQVLRSAYKKHQKAKGGLIAFHKSLGDEFLLSAVIGRITSADVDKELAKQDQHWSGRASASDTEKRRRLEDLILGRQSPTPDPRAEKKSCLQSLQSQKTLNELRGFCSITGDEQLVQAALGLLVSSKLRTLAKRFDRNETRIAQASDPWLRSHVLNLAFARTDPMPKARQKRSPVQSAAMRAKWDGVDRD